MTETETELASSSHTRRKERKKATEKTKCNRKSHEEWLKRSATKAASESDIEMHETNARKKTRSHRKKLGRVGREAQESAHARESRMGATHPVTDPRRSIIAISGETSLLLL